MFRIAIGSILVLHGLVHLWYVTLSQGWVQFQVDMGWTGKSWLFTNLLASNFTRFVATAFYSLATITFLVAGIGLIADQEWSRTWMIVASAISSVAILTFWDGNFNMLVQKGVLGLLINIGILVAILRFKWLA
jgi:hypothetical protein